VYLRPIEIKTFNAQVLFAVLLKDGSRDGSVRIVTDYGLDAAVRFAVQTRDVYLPHNVQTGYEACPTSGSVGSGVLSLVVKWPGREADCSPSCPKSRMSELYQHSSIRLHGMVHN
jgi:hypothetical protein